MNDRMYRDDVVWVMVPHESCTTDSDGDRHCTTTYTWEPRTVTTLLQHTNLKFLFNVCPTLPEYETFKTSPAYKKCANVVSEEQPLADGYTAAAFFGALGAVGGAVGAVVTCIYM